MSGDDAKFHVFNADVNFRKIIISAKVRPFAEYVFLTGAGLGAGTKLF